MIKPIALKNSIVPDTYIVASGQSIPFGAAVTVAAAGGNTVRATYTANEPILGIAGWDKQEMPTSIRAVDGFYSEYEAIPVYTGGEVRVLVIPATTVTLSDTDIEAGDYLEVVSQGSGSTVGMGVLNEAGAAAGTTPLTTAVAKALKYVDLGSEKYTTAFTTTVIGESHIHVTSGTPATMGLEDGDYLWIVDDAGEQQINKVKSFTATQINLVKPITVVATGASDHLIRIMQVEARLL